MSIIDRQKIVQSDERYYAFLKANDLLKYRIINMPDMSKGYFLKMENEFIDKDKICGIKLSKIEVLKANPQFASKFVEANESNNDSMLYETEDSLLPVLRESNVKFPLHFRNILLSKCNIPKSMQGSFYQHVTHGPKLEYFNLCYFVINSAEYEGTIYYYALNLADIELYKYDVEKNRYLKYSSEYSDSSETLVNISDYV